jgi:hypothetical protein
MTLAYVLIITVMLAGQKEDTVTVVLQSAEICEATGEKTVKALIEENREQAQGMGSIWYRCEQVRGSTFASRR